MKAAGCDDGYLILNWPYWPSEFTRGRSRHHLQCGARRDEGHHLRAGVSVLRAKVFAITVPVFVLMTVYGGYTSNFGLSSDSPKGAPKLAAETSVKFKASVPERLPMRSHSPPAPSHRSRFQRSSTGQGLSGIANRNPVKTSWLRSAGRAAGNRDDRDSVRFRGWSSGFAVFRQGLSWKPIPMWPPGPASRS